MEAERHAALSLLQDEMVRESPPLPDRDDSPPPIYRQPNGSNCEYFRFDDSFGIRLLLVEWRDPTLKEVIDYLKGSDEVFLLGRLNTHHGLFRAYCWTHRATCNISRITTT